MDQIQERHERAVGDDFIKWYNEQNGTKFSADHRDERRDGRVVSP